MLNQLYATHSGKISDKWSIYISIYRRLTNELTPGPTRVLEIGIQNGGSLEIWAKLLPNATHIVGCDINPDCGSLEFEDKRISVVVGNANSDVVENIIAEHSPWFDFIIDDGSHKSNDIVRSFARYFSLLKNGGIFVAEDLHCSYWKDFEGGIYHPASSIAFFKRLADVINHEHWGVSTSRRELLADFERIHDTEFNEDILAHVHSIEFVNSMCIIRRMEPTANLLGTRIIAGSKAAIENRVVNMHGITNTPPNQSENEWSRVNHEKNPILLQKHLDLITAEYDELKVQLSNTVAEIKTSRESEAHAHELLSEATEKLKAIELIQNTILARQNPTERLRVRLRRIRNRIRIARRNEGGSLNVLVKCSRIFIKSGPRAVRNYLKSEGKTPPQDSSTEFTTFTETTTESYAFQVLSGLETNQPREYIEEDRSKIIAFYLPQYHRIAENSEWWGPGFTEWTNVVKGRPNFDGHRQPHYPRELGFYDLTSVEVIREQAELAKLYGVSAFCLYYYWFSGRRILETPIENLLNSDIDIEYCLCWANENWTRTWDGDTRSVLMEQQYLPDDPEKFITSLIPYFKDPRYIRVDGKPMLVVYRAKDIPDTKNVFSAWRTIVQSAGFPNLHIAVVDFYDIADPGEVNADALVEFPPHKFNGAGSSPDEMPRIVNKNFKGSIVDYAKAAMQSANRKAPEFTLYRGAMPSWDNTARRQDTPTILFGSTPTFFLKWLQYLRAYTRENFSERADPFIFINAWNEWGEGCHLEPDQQWGLKYLEALKASSYSTSQSSNSDLSKKQLILFAMDSIAKRKQDSASA